MDKVRAKRIIDLVISMEPALEGLLTEIALIDDIDIKTELENSIKEVMGHLMLGVIVPIEQVFPELNPDK